MLLETDSPYMAPVPVRGTRNDSRNVFHIAAKFAEIRGMSTDEIIALTNENGRRFFRHSISERGTKLTASVPLFSFQN